MNKTEGLESKAVRDTITVFLADDHPLVRRGLRWLLESESDFVVAGEAGDGRAALDGVQRIRPLILLADLAMPLLGGLDLLRQVGLVAPETRTIILSVHTADAYVQEALDSGACGYVAKESSTERIIEAVQAVARGRRYLAPPLSESALAEYQIRARAAEGETFQTLTRREREVVRHIAEGRTSVEIASLLVVSRRTVETHRANLTRKLDLHTSADLTRYAIRRGIVALDPGVSSS